MGSLVEASLSEAELIARVLDAGAGRYVMPKVLREGPYAGCVAHVAFQIYTVAVMVSEPQSVCPVTRWCYPDLLNAANALVQWTGVGDPPGPWIKQKPPDRPNPNAEGDDDD